MSALQLERLSKIYGDTVVLDSIDLDLAAGEFCTVVGASGCGKSTLLKLLLGHFIQFHNLPQKANKKLISEARSIVRISAAYIKLSAAQKEIPRF